MIRHRVMARRAVPKAEFAGTPSHLGMTSMQRT